MLDIIVPLLLDRRCGGLSQWWKKGIFAVNDPWSCVCVGLSFLFTCIINLEVVLTPPQNPPFPKNERCHLAFLSSPFPFSFARRTVPAKVTVWEGQGRETGRLKVRCCEWTNYSACYIQLPMYLCVPLSLPACVPWLPVEVALQKPAQENDGQDSCVKIQLVIEATWGRRTLKPSPGEPSPFFPCLCSQRLRYVRPIQSLDCKSLPWRRSM